MAGADGEAGAPPAAIDLKAQRAKARGEPFGYVCNRCTLCCRDKLIQVNPYEIARLARRRGISTSEFVARWTEDGAGARLARRDDGACVFLTPEGCGVHPDRPLVCRVYPLGRHVTAEGVESWSHVAPHPETKGVYSKRGTIADYLAAQGAAPFMRATDEYAAWIRRAYAVVGDAAVGEPDALEAAELLDVDAVIAAHCAETGAEEPLDIEARKALHLDILAMRLDEWEHGSS